MRDARNAICPREAAEEALGILHGLGWSLLPDQRRPEGGADETEAMQRAYAAALAWIERDAAAQRGSDRARDDAARQRAAEQQFYRRPVVSGSQR
jgi:hypothetical protein